MWIYDAYPGGTRQQFTNPDRLAWRQQPCKLVLHTTEGGNYPSTATYDNGRKAPHFTIDPWNRTWRQHYPLSEAAWALKATSLVSTNTMGAVQVEIIGTCDPRNAALATKYVPGLRGDNLTWLLGLLRTIAGKAGIPWQAPGLTWIEYPASYGTGAVQRLSPAAWTAYRGLVGHQHVPGNSHGDPGKIPIDQWLGTAQEGEEDDMTPQEREALFGNDGMIAKVSAMWSWMGGGRGASSPTEFKMIRDRLDGLAALVAAGAADVDESALADKIAAIIPSTIADQVIDALGRKITTQPQA